MYSLNFKDSFDSAHYLPKYKGKCKNTHGHTWNVEINIQTTKLNPQGMVVDFAKLKAIVSELDHKHLNDYFDNPTAENIARYIQEKVKKLCNASVNVRIWESSHSSVAFTQ